MNPFKIKNKEIGANELFFVVEEAMAYWGSFEKAIKMIDAISSTGADAVEFQTFRADDFIVKQSPKFDLLKKLELNNYMLKDVIKHTNDKGMAFIATALSPTMTEMLVESGCDAFNINATDINNPDVIDSVIGSGLPFFLSIPLASEKEIDWAINRIYKKNNPHFGILHGQHTMFSTENGLGIEETAIGYIQTLKNKYNIPIGFIDHTPINFMPSIAVASGAQIITKHLAISRGEKGPDWHVCLEPDEMKATIIDARNTFKSILISEKKVAEAEKEDIKLMRKSIVATQNLKIGHIISKDDISFKRPGDGIPPNETNKIIGKKLIISIEKDHIFNLNNFE